MMTTDVGRSVDIQSVIRERSSVRAFAAEPFDRRLVIDAIEAAGWAPSPHGTQPWRFVLLEEDHARQGLADAMGASWRDQLRLDARDDNEIEHRVSRSKERLERAPIVVILCLFLEDAHDYPDPQRRAAERLMAVQSLGAAAQNFLLAIHASGLDSGWMCAPLFCPEVITEFLGLDASLEPHAMFPVGMMAAPPKRRPRRPVQDLIIAPRLS